MQNMFIIKMKDQYRYRDACEKKNSCVVHTPPSPQSSPGHADSWDLSSMRFVIHDHLGSQLWPDVCLWHPVIISVAQCAEPRSRLTKASPHLFTSPRVIWKMGVSVRAREPPWECCFSYLIHRVTRKVCDCRVCLSFIKGMYLSHDS